MKFFNALLIIALICNPVLAGGYSTSYHNQNFREKVLVRQKIVDFNEFQTLKVIQVPVTSYGPEYYYEAQPLRNRKVLSQGDIDAITQSIMAEFDKRFEVTNEAGTTPASDPDTPNEPDQPQPDPQEPLTLDAQVLGLFQNKCITCHDEGTHKGNLTLIKGDLLADDLTDRQVSNIVDRSEGGFGLDTAKMMPLGGPYLSTEEVELLKRWKREKFSK